MFIFNEKMVGERLTSAKKWFIVGIIMLCTTFAFTVQADILEETADLAVSLSVSPETARPGNDVTYTVVVEHTGDTTEPVKITGSLLNMSRIGLSTRGAGDSTVQTTTPLNVTLEDGMSWEGTMPPNTSVSFIYTATLSASLEDQDTVENVASALIVGADADSDTATVLIDTAGPLRSSEFTAADSVVTLGGSVELTLSIANGGDGLIDAGGIEVTVPAEWTIDSASVPPSVSGNGSAIGETDVTDNVLTANLFIASGESIDLTFSVMLGADAVPNELSTLTAKLSDGDGNVAVKEVMLEKAGPLKDSALTVTNEIVGAGRDRAVMFTLSADASSVDVKGSIEVMVDSELTLVADSVPTATINKGRGQITNVAVNGNTITASFIFLGTSDAEKMDISFSFDVMADEDAVEGTAYTITADIAQDGFSTITRDLMLTAGTPEQFIFLPMILLRTPSAPFAWSEVVDGNDINLYWSVSRVKDSSTNRYLVQESNSETFATLTSESFTTDLGATFSDKGTGTYYYRVFNYETVEGKEHISEASNIITVEIGVGNSSDFFVDDNTLTAGECTQLHWEFENIKSIEVSFGEGFSPIGVQGGDNDNARVCPGVDTTYKAIVTDTDDNKTEYEVEVDVSGTDGCNDGDTDPYMEDLFVAEDTTVPNGQKAELSWHVECASEVYFKAGEGSDQAAAGDSSEDFTITGDTVFRIRVNGNVDYDGTYGDDFDRFQAFVTVEEE